MCYKIKCTYSPNCLTFGICVIPFWCCCTPRLTAKLLWQWEVLCPLLVFTSWNENSLSHHSVAQMYFIKTFQSQKIVAFDNSTSQRDLESWTKLTSLFTCTVLFYSHKYRQLSKYWIETWNLKALLVKFIQRNNDWILVNFHKMLSDLYTNCWKALQMGQKIAIVTFQSNSFY